MTPQEKSEELYNKYYYTVPSFSDEGELEHNLAKKCALIAVKEILDLDDFSVEGRIYWQQVKQEIEKL